MTDPLPDVPLTELQRRERAGTRSFLEPKPQECADCGEQIMPDESFVTGSDDYPRHYPSCPNIQNYEALDSENDRENKSAITCPKRSHEYTENVNNVKCESCTWHDPRIIDRKEIIDLINDEAGVLLVRAECEARNGNFDMSAVLLLTYSELERFRDSFMDATKHAPTARMAEPGDLL